MLSLEDSIALPAGVRVDGQVVIDDVRNARYPANDSALFVLRRAGRPLGDVAEELGRRHRLEPGRARTDVLAFAHALNRGLLANVVRRRPRHRRVLDWLTLAARLAPAGTLPASVARRSPLDTRTPIRAAASTARCLAGRALALASAVAVIALQPLPAAPVRVALVAIALGAGVGGSIILHEAGHAALLAGVGAALVLAGPRTYVLHAPVSPRRRWLVAAAGPASACGLGLAVVVLAWALRLPELAVAGCAPVGHAIGLTVATADGRAACGF
jgi:hypothetical protein